MRVIYEIALEIIIPIVQPVTKTNYLPLWRYPVKVLNSSAKQVGRLGSKQNMLAMFKIHKRVLTSVSYFAFVKMCHCNWKINILTITPSTVNHATNPKYNQMSIKELMLINETVLENLTKYNYIANNNWLLTIKTGCPVCDDKTTGRWNNLLWRILHRFT